MNINKTLSRADIDTWLGLISHKYFFLFMFVHMYIKYFICYVCFLILNLPRHLFLNQMDNLLGRDRAQIKVLYCIFQLTEPHQTQLK